MGIQNRLKIASAHHKIHRMTVLPEFCNGQQGGFLAQAFDVGACGPIQSGCEFIEVHIRRKRHAPATKTKNRRTVRHAWFGERKDIVKPAAAQERRFHTLRAVGCGQEEHALHVPQIVDFAQQLAENPLVNVGAEMIRSELRRQRVDGVKK